MSGRWATVALGVALVAAAGGCGPLAAWGPGPVRLPAALPTDVPLPGPPAVLRAARDQGWRGVTVVFEADGPLDEQEARLRARLQEGGWALLSETAVEDAVFTSYRKAGRSVALGVSRSGGVTVIGITYRKADSPEEGGQG